MSISAEKSLRPESFVGSHVARARTQDDATGQRPLSGGALLAEISNSIVGMRRRHYGRGPMNAKTYVNDDIIVVVMRENGFTPLERTIIDSGRPELVIAMREDFLNAMAGASRRRSRSSRAAKCSHFSPK